MIKRLILTLILMHGYITYAQQKDSTQKKDSSITFFGYAELYYTISNNSPKQKHSFLFNHKRNDQFALNLAIVGASYKKEKTRANLGIMFGDYAQYNYEDEPKWTNLLYELNFGAQLSKKRNIWLDAGIFPSHIGFETPLAHDCWSASRSIVSENSPYYETGIRLSGNSLNKKSSFALYYLNGWQRITQPQDITAPSFGAQYTYTPNDRFSFNYSNFIGRCQADSLHSFRLYNDFYLKYAASKKWGIIVGLDIGMDNYQLNKKGWWLAPVVIGRFQPNGSHTFSVRAEHFFDKHQIIIKHPNEQQISLFGCSFNYDRTITEKTLFRIEYKHYSSANPFFENKSGVYLSNQDYLNMVFSIKL